MKQKIWHVKYIVGNPNIYKKVTTASDGPYRKSDAIKICDTSIHEGWRCWVEHVTTGQVIHRNGTETQWSESDA